MPEKHPFPLTHRWRHTMKLYSFGEILFDTFEDTHTLGGAPLNVAAHFRQLGGESAIISALGNDELGREAFIDIEKLGIDASMISVLDKVPTGIASITMKGNDADYEFSYPAAWDRIEIYDEDIDAIEDDSILYFGTLALRSTTSFLTLERIIGETSPGEIFVDVNIRKDFYSDELIGFCLDNATILKINDDEIDLICSVIGLDTCDGSSLFSWLSENTAIHTLLLTRGKHGSDCFTLDGGKIHEECSSVHVVDTVGAGDSLSAAFLFFRYEKKLSVSEALHKATAVADFVVGHKGAIPLYDRTMFSD